MQLQNIIDAWNAQADEHNQWPELDADERVLFALQHIEVSAREMLWALEVAQTFCNSFAADECPDTVAIPINDAVNTARKYLGKSHSTTEYNT